MSTWYNECKSNHPNCSKPRIVHQANLEIPAEEKPNTSLLLGTRLIDVQKMSLVTAETDTEFVALSYVWGNAASLDFQTKMQNVVAREADGGLSNITLPKTIADAINLTAELGFTYLWVDSLCIIQDDEEKFIEIQNMDVIYGLASLVIVGAAGIDANMGLTGFVDSPRTENNQWVQRVNGAQLMVSSPPFDDILSASKWSTRGWTFQEWYLARRALVFTDQQVYYVCSSSKLAEDLYEGSVPPPPATERVDDQDCISSTTLRQLTSSHTPQGVSSGWIEYQQVIESYTPRELTHESDTLLAILGLLKNLHRSHGSCFICGVSLDNFHDALFWVPVKGTDFRHISGERLFPTWSWAGWNGAVTYSVFPASEQTLVKHWEVRSLDGEQVLFQKPLTEPQSESFVKDGEDNRIPETSTLHKEETEKQRLEEPTLWANYLAYCHLIFEAPAALLQIGPGIMDNSSSNADALVNLEGRLVGVALLNSKAKMGAEVLTRQWDTYMCIATSISKNRMSYTLENAYSQLPEQDDWVNVILVVNSREEEVYIRAGVGQVSKWRWENYAEPQMKRITLG